MKLISFLMFLGATALIVQHNIRGVDLFPGHPDSWLAVALLELAYMLKVVAYYEEK